MHEEMGLDADSGRGRYNGGIESPHDVGWREATGMEAEEKH